MTYLRRTWALVRKEATELLRDRRTLVLVLVMPVVELFLFAYAVSLTLDHLPMAVVDMSLDSASHRFVDALVVSGYFDATLYVEDEEAVLRAIDEGRVKAGVLIPPGFAADLERGDAQVLFILDGADAFSVNSAYAAATMIAQDVGAEGVQVSARRAGQPGGLALPLEMPIRVLYNPNMNDMIFLVPAMAAALVQMLAVNQTAMAVVRERELGVIEGILATPARPLQIMIGKLAPNAVLAFLDTVIIYALGLAWFRVPVQGSLPLFVALSALFVISGLGLGLLVSSIASTQKEAQQFGGVLLLLTMILTGMTYPRAPMPALVRAVGSLMPATYSIRIARGIITKGIGWALIWPDVVTLAVYSVLIMLLSARLFRRRLD